MPSHIHSMLFRCGSQLFGSQRFRSKSDRVAAFPLQVCALLFLCGSPQGKTLPLLFVSIPCLAVAIQFNSWLRRRSSAQGKTGLCTTIAFPGWAIQFLCQAYQSQSQAMHFVAFPLRCRSAISHAVPSLRLLPRRSGPSRNCAIDRCRSTRRSPGPPGRTFPGLRPA